MVTCFCSVFCILRIFQSSLSLSTLGDLEKEKRRLQNILATGEEEPKASHHVSACRNQEVAEQRDRYQIGEATDCML